MDRKNFLSYTLAGTAGLLTNPLQTFLQVKQPKDPYLSEIVKAFVSAGHNNLEKVKELLAKYPNLLYSRHDLGNGDSEEALEGASHVGNKEIAHFLIEQGARPNIFTMAMLGEKKIVTGMIEKYPSLLHSLGAHGFTLLHHAKRGGDEAKPLFEWLEKKGLKEMQVNIKER
jgi:hypothetical protein